MGERFPLSRKGFFFTGAALALALVAIVAATLVFRKPTPSVQERWALYVQNLEPQSKLVVLSSLQKYEASKEFTAMLLAILKVQASVSLSAWADVSYYIECAAPEVWSVRWDGKTRILELKTPPPDCLPPAVRTETIEVEAKGANLVTNIVFSLKKQAEKMRSELSADLLKKARLSLSDKAVQAGIKEGLKQFALSFCAGVLKVKPAEVHIELGVRNPTARLTQTDKSYTN
jgi:hypothetical protein